jgi:hypothetical protein
MKLLRWLILVSLLAAAAAAQNTQQINWLLQNPPLPVPAATVGLVGNAGPAIYYFWIVSEYTIGNSNVAGPFMLTPAPNAFSSSNYAQLSWQAALGASSYDVLMTTTPTQPSGACGCAVATGVTALTYNVQSNSLSAYTVTTVDPNQYGISAATQAVSAGVSGLTFFAPNGAPICQIRSNGVTTCGTGGNGTPGGSLTNVQFYDTGANFGGSSLFTFNKSTGAVAASSFAGAFNGTMGATTPNTATFTLMNKIINPTTYSGSDVGAQINAAISANNCSYGNPPCLLQIPNATYSYATTITLPAGVTLQCGGGTTSDFIHGTLNYTGTGTAISITGGAAQFRNCGLSAPNASVVIDNSGQSTTVDSIYFSGASGTTYTGTILRAHGNKQVYNNIQAEFFSGIGVQCDHAIDVFLNTFDFYGTSLNQTGTTLLLETGCAGLHVDHFSGGSSGLHGLVVRNTLGGGNAPIQLFFNDFISDCSYSDGWYFDPSLYGSELDAHFVNSWAAGAGINCGGGNVTLQAHQAGVRISGGSAINISESMIRANSGSGVVVDNSTGSNSSGIVLTGNQVLSNNRNNDGTESGYDITQVVNGLVVAANTITNSLEAASGYQRYGVNIASSSTAVSVGHNAIFGNVTASTNYAGGVAFNPETVGNLTVTGTCTGCGSGGNITGQANGVIPLATASTAIGAQSHIDDSVTTAATLTATEPIVAPSFTSNGGSCPGCAGFLRLQNGTSNPIVANTVTDEAPATVQASGFNIQKPGTEPSGINVAMYVGSNPATHKWGLTFGTLPPAAGGTGAANTATLTLGTSPVNLATLGTGLVKNTTTTGALSNPTYSDIIALWSSCSGTQYLGYDGNCHSAAGGGTVLSVGLTAPNVFSVGSSPVTTSGTIALTYAALPNANVPDINSPYLQNAGNGMESCTITPTASGTVQNLNNGCNINVSAASVTVYTSPTSSTPGYSKLSTIASGAQGFGAVENGGANSTYTLITGRSVGMSAQVGLGNFTSTNLRVATGFVHTNASTGANFYTCATTAANPDCADTNTTANAFVGYSSSAGSYGSTTTGNWVFVTADGTTAQYTDMTIAFVANTLYEVRVWEDVTGAACSSATPCWCGAIATHTATVGTFTTKCNSTHVPAANTTMTWMAGYDANGGTTGAGIMGAGTLKAMQ